MERIKIAHIITHLELGGAQKTTLLFLKYLDKKDNEAYLITSPGGLLGGEARSLPGIKLYFIPSLVREINPFKDIISFFKILRYLKKEKIRIVHTHSSKAGIIGRWAGKFAGVPYIFHTVHGWPFYIKSNLFARFIYVFLEKITSHITTKIIVVSGADLKSGIRYVNRDKTKYAKISYGIESQHFLRNRCAEEPKDGRLLKSFGIKEDACVVGFVSCLKPQKAPFNFIDVVKQVVDKGANVQFLSVGDGVLRPETERKSLKLGLNGRLKFLGWQKDMPGIFSVIDILLLTSRWEGLPVVFLEAMASGVPVVSTDVGGAGEVIKDGFNGFLKKRCAYKELADDIILLANDADKRKEFSARARESFRKEFDILYMTEQLRRLYRESITGGGGRR